MQSCELVATISAIACAISKGKSPDEIALMATIFSQLGDTLATIAAQEALCAPNNRAAVLTQEDLYKKMISNMQEVKTRGAFLLAVTNADHTDVEKTADYVIYIPKTNQYFANSLAIIPLQLFGYYVALGKGCDVDKPRNLANSVTVE